MTAVRSDEDVVEDVDVGVKEEIVEVEDLSVANQSAMDRGQEHK